MPGFTPFIVHGEEATVATRWIKWLDKFENMMIAINITNANRKRAMLLHYGGDDLYKAYEGLPPQQQPADGVDAYHELVQRFTQHFSPRKNTEFSIYQFRGAKQNSDESLETYHGKLRRLGKDCEFHDLDREIKSQIILGCSSTRLRRRALGEADLTLGKLLDIGRTMEISEKQALEMEVVSAAANSVQPAERRFSSGRNYRGGPRGGRPPQRGQCNGNYFIRRNDTQ